MSDQSFRQRFLARSREAFKKIWQTSSQESASISQPNIALAFLEKYQRHLFPDQTLSQQIHEDKIDPLKLRTTELILKQVNIYYLPNRLESLLPYCDSFTAVATFLNAINFSYETLIKDHSCQQFAQEILKEFMLIDQSYSLDDTEINEFPLYESAATHDLEQFQTTAFAIRRALDIIEILDRMQPRHYEKQKEKILHFWHEQPIEEFDQIIAKLSH